MAGVSWCSGDEPWSLVAPDHQPQSGCREDARPERGDLRTIAAESARPGLAYFDCRSTNLPMRARNSLSSAMAMASSGWHQRISR
jgi:hypothetical protein